MKQIILMFIAVTSLHASWFDGERERRKEVEQQLQIQQQSTDCWQLVAAGLAVGCVVVLIIGVAIGSKTRRDQ